MNIQSETLHLVLGKLLNTPIQHAEYNAQNLHGGTLGDVYLLTGTAQTAGGKALPFEIVRKTQRKWERYGDPGSWRREYDLYTSDLGGLFSTSLRWPVCYHAQLREDEMELWLEYIHGVSGLSLTGDMYELAARELGRFQGRLYAQHPAALQAITNLSQVDYARSFYLHYRSWPEVYDYIRAEDCEIPKHLCKMLIETDAHAEELWRRIEALPVVLCHRDFWVANIFYSDGDILLIDWDTAGLGPLGEDIASLIADEADAAHMVEYYHRCVPAYYAGFSEYADISHITDDCIYELTLFLFGYRLVEWFKFAETPQEKAAHLDTLQALYEIGQEKAAHRSFAYSKIPRHALK